MDTLVSFAQEIDRLIGWPERFNAPVVEVAQTELALPVRRQVETGVVAPGPVQDPA